MLAGSMSVRERAVPAMPAAQLVMILVYASPVTVDISTQPMSAILFARPVPVDARHALRLEQLVLDA